jgi:hypothetical protein
LLPPNSKAPSALKSGVKLANAKETDENGLSAKKLNPIINSKDND